MTKETLNPRTWVVACVRRPKYAYAGTLAYVARVSKTKKVKFFAIMAEVWNESHIVRELFQTLFFPLYKALHYTFSKHTEIPREKYKIH